ncbi:MAG TPA: hypothetical protein VFS67_07025 [Polyangiaceae bacterium]|jgi:hypothetical protein|nr:hypothetical protein [Polyangiaceae bacterium]
MLAVRVSLLGALLAGACAAGEARPALAASGASVLAPVRVQDLVVTSGQVLPLSDARSGRPAPPAADQFAIRAATFRAWVGREPRSAVELDFAYLGPSESDAPLRSGELRRQIGLELRAQDSCNVLYVMWRIAPVPQLMVSLKNNPGQRQHSECRDRGYTNLAPQRSAPLPQLRQGARHVLSAVLLPGAQGADLQLEVKVDGASLWQGVVPPAVAALRGPVGLRSDNGQFDVRLRAGSTSR